MTYAVKEIFPTLQGEGFHTGRPAVFLRFAGCNLWSGREADRAEAICKFCDTDFVGGTRYRLDALVRSVSRLAPRFIVITGGEPLLQLDTPLIDALHAERFEIAVETNGTIAALPGIDWICVSPKTTLTQTSGDELKLVYPQDGFDPVQFEDLDFDHFFLQPMDGPHAARNTRLCEEYCAAHPNWKLSLQTHKLLGIP